MGFRFCDVEKLCNFVDEYAVGKGGLAPPFLFSSLLIRPEPPRPDDGPVRPFRMHRVLFFPACFCIGIGLGKELLFKTHIVRNAGDGTFFHIDEQKNIRHTGIETGNALIVIDVFRDNDDFRFRVVRSPVLPAALVGNMPAELVQKGAINNEAEQRKKKAEKFCLHKFINAHAAVSLVLSTNRGRPIF